MSVDPRQYFGRPKPIPGRTDDELLPKPVQRAPSRLRMPWGPAGRLRPDGPGPLPEGELTAPDVQGLPWRRRDGDQWSTQTFRTEVLAWLRQFLAARPRVVRWEVDERASMERSTARLPEGAQYLIVAVFRREGEALVRYETSAPFAGPAREGEALTRRLAAMGRALDSLMT